MNITNATATINASFDIALPNLIGVFVVGYVISAIASIAGFGGGDLLISLYSLCTGLQFKQLAVLSSITIAGNSLVRVLYYSFKRQENAKNRYLPNYDIILILVIFASNTTYIGYLLNQILPHIVIVIIYTLLMIVVIFITILKIYKYVKKNKYTNPLRVVIYDNIETEIKITQEMLFEREGDTIKDVIDKYIYLILSIILIAFFTTIRSINPILVYIIQLCSIIPLGYLIVQHIIISYKLKKKKMYNFVEGDIQWSNNWIILKYVALSTITGIFVTLLGIGGGSIINPILLQYKVQPLVVTASSGIMTFFTSSVSVMQYLIPNMIYKWYFIVLFVCGCFGAITGIIISRLLRKKIKFIIICMMAILLILGTGIMLIINIIKYYI